LDDGWAAPVVGPCCALLADAVFAAALSVVVLLAAGGVLSY
jgi:hypothetical protein